MDISKDSLICRYAKCVTGREVTDGRSLLAGIYISTISFVAFFLLVFGALTAFGAVTSDLFGYDLPAEKPKQILYSFGIGLIFVSAVVTIVVAGVFIIEAIARRIRII